MGAIGDAFADYARPLLDQSDGSLEDLNKAFAIAQFCWNLALCPEEGRDKILTTMREWLQMDEAEFREFQRSTIDSMVKRHEVMFPGLHGPGASKDDLGWVPSRPTGRAEKSRKVPRNAPCPCGSGRKYKKCCGR